MSVHDLVADQGCESLNRLRLRLLRHPFAVLPSALVESTQAATHELGRVGMRGQVDIEDLGACNLYAGVR